MWKANDGGSSQPKQPPPSARTGPPGSASAPPPAAAPASPGSWRLGASGAAAAPTESAAVNPLLQDANRSGYLVRYYLGLTFALMLLLAGLLIWWIIPYKDATPFVALAVTQYEDWRVPPNSFAQEDLTAFGALWPDNRWETIRYRSESDPAHAGVVPSKKVMLQRVNDMLQGAVRPGGPDKARGAVLMYLSAHGVVNDKDEPCLMLGGFQPFNKEARADALLPVNDLLEVLSNSETKFRKDFPDAHIVLFLDAHRLPGRWQLGMAYNAFSDRLVEELSRRPANSQVHVICAAAPGQEALTAPELGGTAFGHFTALALHGVPQDIEGKDSVSLREVVAYLDREIDNWARQHRGTSQRVLVFPKPDAATDIRLAYRPSATDLPTEFKEHKVLENLEASQVKLTEKLRDSQKLVDAVQQATSDPLVLARNQALLRRAKELWLGGAAYQKELEALVGFKQASTASISVWTPSLALSEAWGDPAQTKAADDLFDDKFRAEQKEKWLSAAVKKAHGYRNCAQAGVRYLLKNPSRLVPSDAPPDFTKPANLRDVLQLLEQVATEDPTWKSTDAVEPHFLRMLEAYLPWEDTKFRAREKEIALTLGTRVEAEQALAPGDDRAWPWIEALAGPLDEQRRQAEDALFLGTPPALERVQAIGAKLKGDYPQLRKTNSELSKAWRTRDEVWADLPGVYEWALRRLWLESTAVDRDQNAVDALTECTEKLDRVLTRLLVLEREFDNPPQDPQAAQLAIDKERTLLEEWQRAVDVLSNDLQNLQKRDADGARTRRLAASLDAPMKLLSSNLRDELPSELLAAYARHDQAPAVSTEQKDRENQPELGSDDDYLRRLRRLPSPLVRLLDGDANPTAAVELPAERFRAAAIEEIRKQQQKGSDLLAKEASAIHIPSAETPSQLSEARAQFSRADRAQRRIAWLVGGAKGHVGEIAGWGVTDPAAIQGWRKFERSMLLAWHARRAVEDFWGPRPGQPEPQSYYAQAAAACERVGKDKDKKEFDARPWADGKLMKLLEDRVKAMLQPSPGYIVLKEGSTQSTVDHPLKIRTDEGLPRGEAAIFLHTGEGRSAKTLEVALTSAPGEKRYRHAWEVRRDPAEGLEFRLPTADLKSGLQVTALYRGHQWSASISDKRESGPKKLVLELTPPPPPKVNVRGRVSTMMDIAFIFDCSASMGDQLAPAKTQFLDLLRALPPESQYRIDLWLYGHRVGWNPAGAVVKAPGCPPGIGLGNDIESIFDGQLRPFVLPIDPPPPDWRNPLYLQIATKLKNIQPLGSTPLYRSMVEALSELNVAGQPSPIRQLVCITDGVNDQRVGDPPVALTSYLQLENFWREISRTHPSGGIPVHVIFVGAPPVAGPKKVLFDELENFATNITGGSCIPILGVQGLRGAILSKIRRPSYVVTNTENSVVVARQPFNKASELMLPESTPEHNVEVAVVELDAKRTTPGMALRLCGGEKVELLCEDGLLRLEPYFERLGISPQKALKPDKTKYWVASGDSVKMGAGRQFPILIERQDGAFTPRPRHIFAEIVPPPSAAGPRPPYYAYDLDFEPDRQVPIARLTTPYWEESWNSAEVRFWFNDDALNDRATSLVPRQNNIVGTMELTLSIDGPEIVVEEKRGATAGDDPPSLIWTDFRPQRIEHERHDNGSWTHRFLFGTQATASKVTVRAMAAKTFQDLRTTYQADFQVRDVK